MTQVFAVLIGKDQWYVQYGVNKAPDNKCPISSVPKTTDQENNKDIPEQHKPAANFTAAKWDVKIVPEPGWKGNVPASPKFGNVPREVRIGKVSL